MSDLEEMFASRSQQMAGRHAWGAFTRRPRVHVEVGARADQESFWREIAPLFEEVGPDPVLVVSRTDETLALRRLGYPAAENRPNLRIEQRPRAQHRGSYIISVEGVDVFGADFPTGEAWLFSAHALQRIRYAELDAPGRYVEVYFELIEDVTGTLRVRFRQQVELADRPVFELRTVGRPT